MYYVQSDQALVLDCWYLSNQQCNQFQNAFFWTKFFWTSTPGLFIDVLWWCCIGWNWFSYVCVLEKKCWNELDANALCFQHNTITSTLKFNIVNEKCTCMTEGPRWDMDFLDRLLPGAHRLCVQDCVLVYRPCTARWANSQIAENHVGPALFLYKNTASSSDTQILLLLRRENVAWGRFCIYWFLW